jgi:hypothetical protein
VQLCAGALPRRYLAQVSRHLPSGVSHCIFYGGDSDWNHPAGNISYLPISSVGNPYGSAVFDNASFSSTQTVSGIFVNVLVDPSELALYTTGYWEIRDSSVQDGYQGILLASGTCALQSSANGQNLGSNIGVWFSCPVAVFLANGTYWFTLVPQGIGATKPIFEWTTSILGPPVGTRKGLCDVYLTAPSCAYYNSSLSGIFFENTLDTTPPCPIPQ